jgi:D-hexose-6-phosphate mutarotase
MQNLQKFEIPGIVHFQKNRFGLDQIVIANELAEAEIYLLGGNLTHYQPRGERPVIFGGKGCEMYPDKTLHAGIPICWPWFGPHPTESSKPQHGFARNKIWELRKTAQLPGGETEVLLGLSEDKETLELFAHSFELLLRFTIGKTVRIELETRNTDSSPFRFTQALHSYFYLSDIDNVTIRGVEDTPFADLADKSRIKQESGPLHIDRVINRVYEPTDRECELIDSGFSRVITVDKEGSNATTIWNPGSDNDLHDLPGDLYRKFVCIESCNAGEDIITLEPGMSHRIIQKIAV